MRTKALLGGIFLLVLFIVSFVPNLQPARATPKTITVPDDYSTIQQAINAANPGDTVFVRNGTYNENVLVNKTVNLIGENNAATIIDGGGNDTVVKVSARGLPLGSTVDNVTVANFTITNSGSGSSDSGLTLDGVDGCNITGNIVTANHGDGIWLNSSWYNNIYGNSVNGNNFTGIVLTYSSYNAIANNSLMNNDFGVALVSFSPFNSVSSNNITGSGEDGIYISDFSNNDTVVRNIIRASFYYALYIYQSMYTKIYRNEMDDNFIGTYLDSSWYNFIGKNTFTNNSFGLWLGNSSYNCMVKNCITGSSDYGIYLGLSSHNTLSRTSIKNGGGLGVYIVSSLSNIFRKDEFVNNSVAIQAYNASDNSIIQNNITNNNEYGFSFSLSANNTILHNNIINNFRDALLDNYPNWWDNATPYSEGGNYWSNYTGTDPNRTGIGNTPQVLNANNTDHYPLMGPYSSYNSSRGTLIVITNSTIQYLNYYSINSTLTMRVSNMTSNQTSAFARFTIPYTMMNTSNVKAYVDNGSTPLLYYNYNLYDNGTYRWIYIAFNTSIHTIDILPQISPPVILSPENKTYNANSIPLTFTFDRTASWMGYSSDGQANVSIAGNTTLTGLTDGMHAIVVYANDTFGNIAASTPVDFTVDTTPPNITNVVQAPAINNVTLQDTVKINATVTDDLSGVKQVVLNYTNGNGTWIAVNMTNIGGNLWNASIPAFPYGTYVNYTISADDNAANHITTEAALGYQYQYHVIPEFTSFLILSILIVVLLLTTLVYRKKKRTPRC